MSHILSESELQLAQRRETTIAHGHAADFRADIQGLRALAVIAVALFHIWPQFVPGGFVGVDVFFVISGYLITGLLFRDLQQFGRISLLRFYARRAKRLLPAACLVLIVVALATPLLPPARWEDTSIAILASALYVENWHLASLAVDYLGAENAPSPVQHYWSLSIEEQFYIVWPLIMIGAAAVSLRSANLRLRLIVPLTAIIVVSLGASIWLTETNRAAAYFVTHTRIWQLGLGGLLAVVMLPDFSTRLRDTIRAAGLLAILISVFAFSGSTAFPGYTALLPTLGCGLVLAAGTGGGRWSPYRILALRPAQYLGDISYSFYLWHWPLIVFAGLYAPGGRTIALGVALLLATTLLADLTKRFVEDPVRFWRIDQRQALALGVAGIACCIVSATVIYKQVTLLTIKSYGDSSDYPGAQAFLTNAPVPNVEAPIPPLTLLNKDKAQAYEMKCHLAIEDTVPKPCIFGPKNGVKVALLGDSHAANWIPALAVLADELGWRLETHTKSACSIFKKMPLHKDRPYPECGEWGENVLAELRRSPPDLVIMTQGRFHRIADANGQSPLEQTGAALAELWSEIESFGIKIVALRDTPFLPFDPDGCILRDNKCYAEQSKILNGDDPILIAHRLAPDVSVIDMTDAICRDGKCPMIIGNVVVWRDRHHLTATYSRTAASTLGKRIVSALGQYSR